MQIIGNRIGKLSQENETVLRESLKSRLRKIKQSAKN